MTVKNKRHHNGHNSVSADVEKIKAALFDATHHLKGHAGEVFTDSMHTMKDQTSDMRDSVAHYTAKQPFKALGIAIATGVVLGMWLRRK